jgi:hypothetical protein
LSISVIGIGRDQRRRLLQRTRLIPGYFDAVAGAARPASELAKTTP